MVGASYHCSFLSVNQWWATQECNRDKLEESQRSLRSGNRSCTEMQIFKNFAFVRFDER